MKYTANGVQLNVLEQGNGSLTLVFLHYFGGSSLEWQDVMSQLSDQHRCIAVDLRGCGDSDAQLTGYSVNDMANDVADLLRVLAVQDFVLIGHSMSGKVALALASRQPTELKSLILISPSPPLPEPISDEDRQDMLTTYGQREAAEQTFEKITARPVSEATKEQIILDNLRTSEPAWKAWLNIGSLEDNSAQMKTVDVPVAILVGTADKAIAPDVQKTMTLPLLKNATFNTVDDAGHLLPWEVPDMLVDFIQKKITAY